MTVQSKNRAGKEAEVGSLAGLRSDNGGEFRLQDLEGQQIKRQKVARPRQVLQFQTARRPGEARGALSLSESGHPEGDR